MRLNYLNSNYECMSDCTLICMQERMCDCIHFNINVFYLSIHSAKVFTAVHLEGREMYVHVFVCLSIGKVWEGASVVYFMRHGI